MQVYRITNWDEHFEVNRTRELKYLAWVAMPTKMDGDGYTELTAHPDAAAHLGAWDAIVRVASRCDPRGTLLREGRGGRKTAHTPHSLARITRLPAAAFEAVIPRVLDIGWLEVIEIPHGDAEKSHDDAEIPQDAAPRARANTVLHGTVEHGTERSDAEKHGAERSDVEGEETEEGEPAPPARSAEGSARSGAPGHDDAAEYLSLKPLPPPDWTVDSVREELGLPHEPRTPEPRGPRRLVPLTAPEIADRRERQKRAITNLIEHEEAGRKAYEATPEGATTTPEPERGVG